MSDHIAKVELGKPAEGGDLILKRRWNLAGRLSPILKNGGKLLDLGCGNGAQTAHFIDQFDEVVGVDIRPEPMADSLVAAKWVTAFGENLPFDDSSFDAIVSFEVLEHVEDPAQTVREFKRVLKPGGFAVISVPNKWWVFETHGAHLPLLPWNRVPLFSWLPKPLHSRWAKARIYTKQELRALISEGGFKKSRIHYITAPMDRARPKWLQTFLQKTLFSSDLTSIPFLSVNHIAIVRK